MREFTEQEQKEKLWESIALLNKQIYEEKAEKAKPIRIFNREFQKELTREIHDKYRSN